MGRVLFLVPARGGSRGIPGKNLTRVDGASLVARAVICAHRFLRECPLPETRLVVDTDSEALAAEARAWHAEVPFLRPEALAQDSTTTVESTLHLLDRLGADGWIPDTIVLLQPTSPLRTWGDLCACWTRMEETGAESVISVVDLDRPPQLAMELGEGNVLGWLGSVAPPAPNSRRQDLAPAVSPSGAVYIVRAEALRSQGSFVVPGATIGVRCDDSTSHDVDTPQDLLAAQRAAALGAAPAPTELVGLERTPAAGEVVKVPGVDGRLLVVGADTLPTLIRGWESRTDVSGVLILPEPGAPGPAVWREALGCTVALWCGAQAVAVSVALQLGAADLIVVPRDMPEAGELVRGLLRASERLRG